MKNIILKNGIFGGIIVALEIIAMTLFMKAYPDTMPSMVAGFGSMLLAFVFVFLGIKQERGANNGWISFGKAFKTGLLITVLISVIYVGVWLVVYYNFFPDFIEKYSAMVLKNTNPEDLVAKTAEMNQMQEWYKNPIMIILLTFMEILPFGILVTLISALILKKKES
jgi:Protein of unknown function (DUF4199)